ncbi:MAG TPA: prepilin-type N-terminal cleavage/methylation domain-containing protein [Acidiferrobacteraceae bacterium]|nr:prepilin-type N-terminal cleavage/methylation domain-containing protein [Acidiferrobacteraceae bacterium]HEX19741.1 prepilin-type N-terminal cleavage/methylation domain-containing protein [Acidiferrobacteraceae bacterium]
MGMSHLAFSGNKPHLQYPGRYRGFTLIELIVTLAIAAILVSLSVSVPKLLQHETITSKTNNLIADLSLTRSEAVKTGEQVLICKSQDQVQCSRSGNWDEGRLIFIDKNKNYQKDPDEQIIRVRQPLPGFLSLRFSAWGPGNGRYLSYQPSGFVQQNGTFAFCDRNRRVRPRGVLIMQSGRARISYRGSTRNPELCP